MAENFVLVHGAWHGAWCWAAVANQLRARGDNAVAVDLPGHGQSRFDLARVTLPDYVDGVAKFIEEADLSNVVLVGHSMGGLVIPGVAVKLARRVRRVIFATAMVMADGETPLDRSNPAVAPLEQIAAVRPDRALPIDAMREPFRTRFMQDAAREFQDFVLAALTPQPIAPLTRPVAMKDFYRLDLPSAYMICDHDGALGDGRLFHENFLPKLHNPATRTIASDHEFMFTHPVEGAQALYELARA